MATKPKQFKAKSMAPKPGPVREDMAIYVSPYNAIHYETRPPSACSECIVQGKECAHECWSQTRHCVSEMSLCQALGVGCIIPPLCTPLLLGWCWYRGNGVRD